MNAKLKKILVVTVKQATAAVLTNTALSAMLPTVFNVHSAAGIFNFLKAAASVVISREIVVWGPVLYKWAMTDADPTPVK
jgi:hypothetical protein